MEPQPTRYTGPRKWNWPAIALVAGLHVALFVVLINALAPNITQGAVEAVESALTVTITAPPDEPEPEPSDAAPEAAGAAGEAGDKATPREVTAPEPAIRRPDPPPAPRASSTGSQNRSGASQGEGTGAGGSGDGTGAGGSGSGAGGGGGIATRPSVQSGRIDSARDYPVPPGGREVRFGTSVTVIFTVTTDGRARDCSVYRPGPDPETNRLTCELVTQRIRFNPARDADGNPVEARYAWRQDFSAR